MTLYDRAAQATMDYAMGAAMGGISGATSRFLGRVKRQREPERDDGGFYSGQYQKYEFSHGKKKNLLQLLRKLDYRECPMDWCRFGRCNRLTDAQGAYKLSFSGSGAAFNLPLYTIDLTSRQRFGTSVNYHKTMHRAVQEALGTGNSQLTFVSDTNTAGAGNNGTTLVDAWQYYRTKGTAEGTGDFGVGDAPAAVLEYTDAKFLFTAPTSRPGYVKICLVQLHDGYLAPTAGVTESRTAAYQNLLKPLMYNPIFSGQQPNNHKHFKILKTWVKNFYPDSVDNRDTNGQKIRMDIFVRHNRYVQFRPFSEIPYLDTQPGGTVPYAVNKLDDDVIPTNNDPATNAGSGQGQVYNYTGDPKARLYFFVMGTSFDDASLPRSAANEISFDMEIRQKWIARNA